MRCLKFFFPWLLFLCSSFAHAGYADREPACPAGQKLEAGVCYDKCKDGENGIGNVCWGQCPAGTKDVGGICSGTDIKTRDTYGRGAGTVPNSCPAGTENNGGLCYSGCRSGYMGVGPVCWEQTPSGWYDAGLFFYKPILQFRSRGSYGRGVGTFPNVCPAGKENSAGLCYSACKPGYSGTMATCSAPCPAGYNNDGLFCRKETTVGKPTHWRGSQTPPANDGYCDYQMPLTTKNGKDRLYSQTAFVGTHNSYASVKDGYTYAMQTFDVQRQLEGGVRVINLDIFLRNGNISICHQNCDATLFTSGVRNTLLIDQLLIIKRWMDKNPNEIVTLVFESYVKDNLKVELALKQAGLNSMIYAPDTVGINSYPTLKEMIARNQRLVVLTQESADAGNLIKLEWNYFIENMYGFDSSLNNYDVTVRNLPLNTPNRGFLLNHFPTVTTSFQAIRNNSEAVLRPRVFETAKNASGGRLPTVLFVDFYQLPFCEAFKVVKDVNDSF